VDLARGTSEQVVFFATGFETTAVATAAVVLAGVPDNFSVLSAHKYIPPVMEIVAEMPDSRVEGFLAAGHAATITGSAVFERFVQRHQVPVVVAGFEPLDILAALARLAELIRQRTPIVVNMFPRCVTEAGNTRAQTQLWQVFQTIGGRWRGLPMCRTATCDCATTGPTSTRGGGSRSTPRRSGTMRRPHLSANASAETSWRGSRRRRIARCSAARACRIRQSAPAWSALKALAESGTSTAAFRSLGVCHVHCRR
jgi:hypothetical protein